MGRKLEKIYVVFKTHFDIGFTGLVSDVVERYRTEMLRDVNSICEQTESNPPGEKYVWTMSAWPLLQSLEGSGQEERDKAARFLQNRQLIWHMLPYTTHTEFCGLEEWIRGMYVSRELSERFGYTPKDAKMTDVPGHTWSVPSLLAKAGVKILHLGCNPASTPPDVPPVFLWEGPDGARLLTFYSKGSYGTGILPPEEWEHSVWLAMIQTSDNHGPHDPSIIQEMKESIAESGLDAELHIGSLSDFAEDFLSRNPDLPVVRGDLADSWIHGVGTAPREVSRARELRGRIAAVESAWSLAKLAGEAHDSDEIKKRIDESYEFALLFGEHTWGMDCKTFLFPKGSERRYRKKEFLQDKATEPYRLMERSWQEQRDYLNKAEAALEAAELLLSGSAGGADDKTRVLRVYNHLGWKRDARVLLSSEQLPGTDEALVDCETGEPVRLTPSGNGAWAEVRNLPALGYKALAVIAAERETAAASLAAREAPAVTEPAVSAGGLRAYMTETAAVLENVFLTVTICRYSGWVRSLWDKRLHKEFVDKQADYGFGQYEYNVYSNREITRYLKKYAYRFYDWGVHDFGKTGYPEEQKRLAFTTGQPDIELTEGEGSVRVTCTAAGGTESTEEYGNARRIGWSFTLTEDAYLDLELRLEGKEETPKAESGSLVFPLRLDNARYRINKMGSVIDPVRDVVRSSSTLLHCCEHFVDVTGDGGAGMAVVPFDTPLFFIGRNGMWDFEHEYRPEKPELHFNLFNNWWGTNFPQWTGGDFRYRYRLIPHAGDWSEAEVWKRAEEVRNAPLVLPVRDSRVAGEPPVTDLLPLGLDGAAVTCFKPAEDGDGFILRLREWSGRERELVLTLPPAVRSVTLTDLLEHNRRELALEPAKGMEGGQVRLQTKAFEVHTLRLRTIHSR